MDDLLSGHVDQIRANEEKCREYFDKSPMIITALLPVVGYEKATELIDEFLSADQKDMRGFLENKLGVELIEKVFSPYKMTALGHSDYERNAKRK